MSPLGLILERACSSSSDFLIEYHAAERKSNIISGIFRARFSDVSPFVESKRGCVIAAFDKKHSLL
jgi:hypothetical protein